MDRLIVKLRALAELLDAARVRRNCLGLKRGLELAGDVELDGRARSD